MRTVCIINNYNYGHFLEECLNSALLQTRKFDSVIIVDDGSTDNSRELLSATASIHPNAEVILKTNGGQLSCFHTALPRISTDDFVCLLDSDDVLPPDYADLLMREVQRSPAEFYFCEPTSFTAPTSPLKSASIEGQCFTWPCSSHMTRLHPVWLGRPTSCVSMTGQLFRKLLPYRFETDWRFRADDVFVLGSSIIGASKRYLGNLTVGYRVHGENAFHGRTNSEIEDAQYQLRLDKLFNFYCETEHISRNPNYLSSNALREFSTTPEMLKTRFCIPPASAIKFEDRRGLGQVLRRLDFLRFKR